MAATSTVGRHSNRNGFRRPLSNGHMSYREISNARTQERIVFRANSSGSDGELLEMDDFWQSAEHSTPAHIHPHMEERWEVIAGSVQFQIGEASFVAGPGDVAVAPPGVRHSARNAGGTEVQLRIQMRPALRWAEFVTELFALASEDHEYQTEVLELIVRFPDEIAI
jgi:mannose-6-phosphate isomerase-like protein (cupin superfamily)